MKKLELRKKMITYCDWCKKEITDHTHAHIKYKDGRDLDFCSVYNSKIEVTCYDKHKKEEIKKMRDLKKSNL